MGWYISSVTLGYAADSERSSLGQAFCLLRPVKRSLWPLAAP